MTPASPKDDAGPFISVSGATGSEVGAGDGTRTGDTGLHLRVKKSAGDGSLRDGSEDGKSLEWGVAEKAGSITTEETMAREDEGRDLVKAEAREGEEHIPQEGELSATEPLHDQSPTPPVIVDAHVPALGAWQDAKAGGDLSTRVEEAEANHPLGQRALTHESAAVEDTTADMTRVDERSAVHVQEATEGMDADSDNGSDPLSATPWEAVNPPSANGHPKAQGYSPPKAFGNMQTKARPAIPYSSYYFGPPPPDSAYGTPPTGRIGLHHPREILRVERDYTGGELTQFAPIYPLELEGRITPTQFLESINAINELLISAHSLRHSALDNTLAVVTLNLSRLFFRSHYEREMQRLERLIGDLNAELYNPVGLNILWPRNVAFLFLEIEYY